MPRLRRFVPLLALACLAPPAAAQAQGIDYVDLEDRKPLGLRLAAPGAVAGSALATGDFNGDGNDDLVVGAHGASPRGRAQAGGVEVLYGPIVARKPRARLVILGAEARDRTGMAVAEAGDLDGDGASELAIGAPQASPLGRPAAGVVYVVPGGRTGVIDLADPAFDGQRLIGARQSDNLGRAVVTVGDQNDDDVFDLLVGAPGADPGARVRAGAAYVVRGLHAPGRVVDLATASGLDAFRLAGPGEGAVAGWSVAGGDDRDGDDLPDYAIGAPEDVSRSGRVFLVSGGWRPAGVDLGTRPPGVQRVVGPRGGQLLGYSLAEVGDFDGDGLSDIAAGAWGANPRKRRQAGQVYVLTKDPRLMRPTMLGAGIGDRAGRAVASAGDVNGDGRADLLIGASAASLGDADYAGSALVVRGGSGRTVDMDNPDKRILYAGSRAQARLGDAVAGDADLDGDGRSDVALGIPGAGGMQRRGAVMLVPNPYPVRLRVSRTNRSWCANGRLAFTVGLDGAAVVRASLSGAGRLRTLKRRLDSGLTELRLSWSGRRQGGASLRVRATGRDGRRVQRRVTVPAGC